MTEHLCSVCGYREKHGVIFGRVIAHRDVGFEGNNSQIYRRIVSNR